MVYDIPAAEDFNTGNFKFHKSQSQPKSATHIPRMGVGFLLPHVGGLGSYPELKYLMSVHSWRWGVIPALDGSAIMSCNNLATVSPQKTLRIACSIVLGLPCASSNDDNSTGATGELHGGITDSSAAGRVRYFISGTGTGPHSCIHPTMLKSQIRSVLGRRESFRLQCKRSKVVCECHSLVWVPGRGTTSG